jgi:hypothetical protein
MAAHASTDQRSVPPLQQHLPTLSHNRVHFVLQKQGRQPDFKLREKATDGRKDAVWISDSRLPQWVKNNLQLLPGGIPYFRAVPEFIPASAASGDPIEQQWVEVFCNYGIFWDNRKTVSWGLHHGCSSCHAHRPIQSNR